MIDDGPSELYRVPRLLVGAGQKARFVERDVQSPEDLYKLIFDYFDWCDKNPFVKVRHMQVSLGNRMGSEIQEVEEKFPRMYTTMGMVLHAGISVKSYYDWRNPESKYFWPEAQPVIEWAETVIRDQNITLAAANLLNVMLVMRAHGMREHLDVTPAEDAEQPAVDPKALTKQERVLLYRAMKRGIEAQDDEILK